MGSGNTKDSEAGGADQNQKLQQRSFLHKFEQDYMNPIFGGPDPVIPVVFIIFN
jgi:hypothetical protein